MHVKQIHDQIRDLIIQHWNTIMGMTTIIILIYYTFVPDRRSFGQARTILPKKKQAPFSTKCRTRARVSTKTLKHGIFLIRWFLTATSGTKPIIVSAGHVYILLHQRYIEKRKYHLVWL